MSGSNSSEGEMKQSHGAYYPEPAVGIPYTFPPSQTAPSNAGQVYGYGQQGVPAYGQPVQPPMMAPAQQVPPQYYYSNSNPYQPGMIPPNAVFGSPNGIPLRETYFADTPAPFECPHCGKPGLTFVKSSPSLAACVACLMSIVGVCFLCKSCDCLWHKKHYCPNCGQKVAEFKKSDPCIIVDPIQWQQQSFAIPS